MAGVLSQVCTFFVVILTLCFVLFQSTEYVPSISWFSRNCTTTQLHWTESERRFHVGTKQVCGMSQVPDDEDFLQCSADIYLLKVNNRNTRKRCETCLKLTMKTAEQRQWCCSSVLIINFEHMLHLFLVFLLSTLNKLLLSRWSLLAIRLTIHLSFNHSTKNLSQLTSWLLIH